MTNAARLNLSHAGLFVCDLPRMEALYTGILGLMVTDRGQLGEMEIVFLSRDPQEHHQVVLATGRPAGHGFTTENQLSFRVDGLTDLRSLHLKAKTGGAASIHSVHHGNAISVYFADPEGNRIEIFMDTPWHVSQPVREAIDFSLSDTALINRIEQRIRLLPGFSSQAAWREQMEKRLNQG